ncbi:predicted protein [Verticillium alfalfae VaMs.102]|uniref:Predicted protein n=1 Tax=Verticillium alfalfae (strain VaMs.102 / ATCC MYA-4576 / FGSC 10136) TaxID=526221 RepID=C9SFH3_VERA1|nr:predicted protein [Verticillium alfalfae VaMs.102]EEY17959.1 predicted protein [Verticillium alfalfae VaMs.102]
MNQIKTGEDLCHRYVSIVVIFRGLFQMLVAFDRVSRNDPVEFDLGRASNSGAATTLCFSNSNMRGKIIRLTMQVIPSEYSKYGGDQAVVVGLMESNDHRVKAYGGMKEAKRDTFGKARATMVSLTAKTSNRYGFQASKVQNQEYEYEGSTVRFRVIVDRCFAPKSFGSAYGKWRGRDLRALQVTINTWTDVIRGLPCY